MSSVEHIAGPVEGIVVYMIMSAGGKVEYVGSTSSLKKRREAPSTLRYAPAGCVLASLGPFETRAEAYRTEDRLLKALTPPLNSQHFVHGHLLAKER